MSRRANDVTVHFADGTTENVPPGTQMRLEHGGWLVIVDHIRRPQSEGGPVERSRAFPPSSITSVVTLRPEGD